MVFVYICLNNNKLIISSCMSCYGKHECSEKKMLKIQVGIICSKELSKIMLLDFIFFKSINYANSI